MNIIFGSVFNAMPIYQSKYNNRNQYPNFKPLSKDTISFGSMKKSDFNDIDLLVVNKFKIPVEKFNTNNDLQRWSLDKLNNEYIQKDLTGRQMETIFYRKHIIFDWLNYLLENKKYNNSTALFIIDSLISNLKHDNDVIPPPLNKDILDKTLNQIKINAEQSKNFQVNFDKLYEKNLQEHFLEEHNKDLENDTGWIIIKGAKNDAENFLHNAEKLKALSLDTWCTKSTNAEPHLLSGDFHIYIENRLPKIGIRFLDDEIIEIQDHKNDNEIPASYLDIIEEHTKGFQINPYIKFKLENAINERKERSEG